MVTTTITENAKEYNVVDLDLTVADNPNFSSNRCQVRDVLGVKCTRKADMRFSDSKIPETKKFENLPVCIQHYLILRRSENTEPVKITFERAADLLSE